MCLTLLVRFRRRIQEGLVRSDEDFNEGWMRLGVGWIEALLRSGEDYRGGPLRSVDNDRRGRLI